MAKIRGFYIRVHDYLMPLKSDFYITICKIGGYRVYAITSRHGSPHEVKHLKWLTALGGGLDIGTAYDGCRCEKSLLYSFGPAPNTAIVNDMKNVELVKVLPVYIFVFAPKGQLASKMLSRPLVWLANGIPFVCESWHRRCYLIPHDLPLNYPIN